MVLFSKPLATLEGTHCDKCFDDTLGKVKVRMADLEKREFYTLSMLSFDFYAGSSYSTTAYLAVGI